MEKITYEFHPVPAIEVNGQVFTLQMSDADIFDRAIAIQAKYKRLGKKPNPAKVMSAVKECSAVVDEMLGKGAMDRISGGKPVRMSDAINIMLLIAGAAAKSYGKKLESYE